MSESPNLKPCPFCGSAEQVELAMRGGGGAVIRCSSCDAALYGTTPESTVKGWNRREGAKGTIRTITFPLAPVRRP